MQISSQNKQMKKFLIILLVLLFALSSWPEKIAEFDLPISGPTIFKMNASVYLIASIRSGTIYLFDRQNLKQTGQIGNAGEGPGGFRSGIMNVMLDEDRIYVSSMGRISSFEMNGTFIRDVSIG